MGIERVWVVVDSPAGSPRRVGLELLTAARRVAAVVEAVHWGSGVDAVAPELGRYGASRVLSVGDLGAVLPGVPVAAAMAARVAGGDGPDAVFLATTHDQRDVAGRLSARLDRPVLTNAVGLADGGGLVAEHAVFGGSTFVRARITAPPPHLVVFRPRSFAAEPLEVGLDPAVELLPVPDTGPAGRATVRRRVVAEAGEADLDEAAVVVAGGRGVGGSSGFEMV
ncbi:MAG: electron transfer flavoprotein subunit alpha/FixB family protein, partial [Actinomycetota bacterium]|nr:electron transfer flavoprotein subunit alpha/FixB family protein [Actinomycetota bacterium]